MASPEGSASFASFSSAFSLQGRLTAPEAGHHAYASCQLVNAQGTLVASEHCKYGNQNSQGRTGMIVNYTLATPAWHCVKTISIFAA